FTPCLTARTVIAGVIHIIAVNDVTEPTHSGQFLKPAIKLMLAEVAAIRRIFDVIGVLHFLRYDEFMTKVVAFQEIQSDLSLMAGIAWAFGCHGQCLRWKLLLAIQGKYE